MSKNNEKQIFIFVVSAGRSGQSSFSQLLAQAYPKSYVAFEEPQICYILPNFLSRAERKFRRAFIETDELLGRGRVLNAFSQNDKSLLKYYGLKKFNWLRNKMIKQGVNICFEVNKHFLHGLHVGMESVISPNHQVVHLVRDPLLNMRSYLNRNKNFYLDNGAPDCEFNEIKLNPARLTKGQLYLHAWCECYLRANSFAAKHGINKHTLLTQDLTDMKKMNGFFEKLCLPHEIIKPVKKTNTNEEKGFGETKLRDQDICEALNFIDMLPVETLAKLPLLLHFINQHSSRSLTR